jgi:hypothetical protein
VHWPPVSLAQISEVDEVVIPADAFPVARGPDGLVGALGTESSGIFRIYFPGLARFDFHPPRLSLDALATGSAQRRLVEELFVTTVQPLVLHLLGFEALHASAVGTVDGIVAFCGMSGTGKSTIAYGLTRRGLSPWADDVVVIDPDGGSDDVECLRLPHPARIPSATREFFGAVGDERLDDGEAGQRITLRGIVVLERRRAGHHEIRWLQPVDALSAALPHAFRFTVTDRERTERTMVRYLDLVSKVPVFRAAFVPSFDLLPEFLDDLESSLSDLLG